MPSMPGSTPVWPKLTSCGPWAGAWPSGRRGKRRRSIVRMAKKSGRAAPGALALAFIVAFVLAVGAGAGYAGAAPDGSAGGGPDRPAIGLREAVLEALAHSPSIRAARARLAEAEAAAAAAEAEAGGRIDGEVNGGYSWLSPASLRSMMPGGTPGGGGDGGGAGLTPPLPTSGAHVTRGTGPRKPRPCWGPRPPGPRPSRRGRMPSTT